MGKHELIVYGAFKAMGDFVSAAPVIKSELDSGSEVCLLIFPGLESFVRLLDFGESSCKLRLIHLPVSGFSAFYHFLRQMKEISPEIVWISPHAPAPASSWKIPLLLWIVRTLYWPGTIIAGSCTERMSVLFDTRSKANRALPFAEREWQSYSVLKRLPEWGARPKLRFQASIQEERQKEPLFDLLIHPGAGAANRKWPFRQYPALVDNLPKTYRIAVVALPEDIEHMRRALPLDSNVQFISGTLEQSIQAIARSRALLSMDSGNMFFADLLDVPGIAIFGASDPASVIGFTGSVLPIYQKSVQCQPCGRKACIHSEPMCITSISPAYVAAQLVRIIERSTHQLVEDNAISR
jgi:heptosyltransferase-2